MIHIVYTASRRKRGRGREKEEMDPEGKTEWCDKTWINLSAGHYRHTNAAAGKHSRCIRDWEKREIHTI